MRKTLPGLGSVVALTLAAVACSEDSDGAPAGGGGTTEDAGGSTVVDGGNGGPGTAALTWTKSTITGADAAMIGGIKSMAFGGGTWVAIATAAEGGIAGKFGFALTSSDGKTWTQSFAFPLNYRFDNIAYDGAEFVATGSGPKDGNPTAYSARSSDGAAWTIEEVGGDSDGAVAIAFSGTTKVFTGLRGKVSVKAGAAAATTFTTAFTGHSSFASCNIGTRVISVGQIDAAKDTDPAIVFADDPSTAGGWQSITEPGGLVNRRGTRFYGIACDEARSLAVGAGKDIWVSVDKGTTWTLGHPESEGDSTTWQRVVKLGSSYVIVGWRGAYGVTTDGTDLTVGTLPSDRDFSSLATDGTIVVAGSGGQYNDRIASEFYWAQP